MIKLNFLISALCSISMFGFAQSTESEVIVKSDNVTSLFKRSSEVSTYAYSIEGSSIEDLSNDPSKSKSYSKSFSIDKQDKVEITNRYGNITVKTWAKQEVKVDAQIIAYARTEKEVNSLLERVNIQAEKANDVVKYNTVLDLKGINSFGSGTKNGERWRRELKINMVVYVPISQSINLSQSYGSIQMENHEGPTSLRAQYGNVVAGDLKNASNSVSVQYGKATLGNVNKVKLSLSYGGKSVINEAQSLQLTAQYSGLSISKIHQDATIKIQYGSGLNVSYAKNMELTAQYTTLNMQTLSGLFNAKVQYGRINIAKIEDGVKQFKVLADYSPVNIGFASDYNGGLTVATSYGSFKYGERVKAQELSGSSRVNTSKQYQGGIGSGSGNQVNITSRYSSVTIK